MAAARIAAGALNGRSVDDLATELGVSARQLRRAVHHELGVSPIELAQTHRLLLAKHLLTDTGMTVARVAFASGFQSLRRFNTLFRQHYRLNPTALRRGRPLATSQASGPEDDVVLALGYRPPLAWSALLRALHHQAIPGIEWVTDRFYSRTVRIGAHAGTIRVEAAPRTHQGSSAAVSIRLTLSETLLPAVMALLPRIRALFDLDAEPELIDEHLTRTGLGPLVLRRGGVRAPGAFDGFEVGLRVLLQETAPKIPPAPMLGALAAALGESMRGAQPELRHLFPTPAQVAGATPARLAAAGVPSQLVSVVHHFAGAVADGAIQLGRWTDAAVAIGGLTQRVGLRRSTAELIVQRAASSPDLFARRVEEH